MKFKLTIVVAILVQSAFAQSANRNDVIMTELMADPSPPNRLPAAEYIELKNVSRFAFNLSGWKISDGNTSATIPINFILQPDSIIIVCASSSATLFSGFGTTIGVSGFPSLDNEGDLLFIQTKEGKIIHAITFHSSWYSNDLKATGGWSLEMIDTKHPCTQNNNWKASTHNDGGTPGKRNSVEASITDERAPRLLRAFAEDSLHLHLYFDETIDSATAGVVSNYHLNQTTAIVHALPLQPMQNEVLLTLSKPLQKNIVETITVNAVADCRNNLMERASVKVGLASQADSLQLVINEVLFNPRSEAVDFVEFYNRSHAIIDLAEIYIANRSSTGNLNTAKQISSSHHLIFPGEYAVVTENTSAIEKNYFVKDRESCFQLNSMPSFPDDKGTVVIVNKAGFVIDELTYDEKWHFALISHNEGVSLERVSPDKPTQYSSNWHSAATTVGYATPSYKNSQLSTQPQMAGSILTEPSIFSPDNDGFNDIAFIHYQFEQPGFVCNISVYDMNGRLVNNLVRNALCSSKGMFSWDGLDENKNKLPVGLYIVVTEIFNLHGKTQKFKNVITLARRF